MFITYLKTQWFEYKEKRRVEQLFYHNKTFKEHDQKLLTRYRGQNPYQLAAQFLRKRGASNVHAYGETPLTTMAKIVETCGIRPDDRVIEMGGGRGRVGLFLATYYQCQVTTYEQIETFVEKGVKCDNHKMVLGDMFEADFSHADVIYLYGTMLEEAEIVYLANAFPPHVKVITVTYPLEAYDGRYQTKKTFSGTFPWGKTEIYLNERTCE